MSIATKLEKLTTDITNAYTSIENKGGTIPANKNTNNLSTAIDSIEVIEQATAEGESISLANTKAMPYSDYVVEGKSEQDGEPSPSNPSEIHSVADDVNLLNVKNTILNFGDVSFTTDNNHLILTATGTSGSQACKNIINNLDTLKSYTLSLKARKNVKGTNGNPFIKVNIYGSDMTFLGTLENANPTQGQTYSFSKTVSGYSSYILYIYNNSGNPVTSGEQTEFWDIKLQEGSIATPYSPYNQGTVTIKQRGKNLFDINDFVEKASTVLDVTSIGNEIELKRSSTTTFTYFFNFKENTQYTIKLKTKNKNSDYYVFYLYSDNTTETIFQSSIYNEYIEFTKVSAQGKTLSGIRIELYGWNNDMFLKDIQLEERNTSNFIRTISRL